MKELARGRLRSRKQIYEGRIVGLLVDEIEVNGFETIREVVQHPGGVVVLAEVEPDRIPFVRQHRYPINKDILELPAGKLDSGEDPEFSAARELEEETGYRALEVRHVCSFYTSPGFCDELLHCYYTDRVEISQVNREADEELVIEYYGLEEALEMVGTGRIQDGKTITALYWLFHERMKQKS